VIVDLHSLDGQPGAIGGDTGWAAPLPPEACRRLACDATVTRVVVHRQPGDLGEVAGGTGDLQDPSGGCGNLHDPSGSGLAGLLRAAIAKLPPILGGAPAQPLDVGRSTRVVTPAQRQALAVRDGGCVFPGCGRPVGWCEAHHVRHWLAGARPTWTTWP
jgi:hypothetical protein